MDYTKEVYLSCDIESDGPCPGLNSMLSVGIVAIGKRDGEWDSSMSFSANLLPLPDATRNNGTMEFWNRNPEAWKLTTDNQRDPHDVMVNLDSWLGLVKNYFGRKPVGVGAPAAFDFPFIRHYFFRFLGRCPLPHSCIDMKTLASSILRLPYEKSGKRSYPKKWFVDMYPHTHVAVEDAKEQAYIFIRMLEDL